MPSRRFRGQAPRSAAQSEVGVSPTPRPGAPQTAGQRGTLAVVGTDQTRPLRSARLPAQPTPLIGREHDLETARREILEGGHRLLTLTGPPGVGKTRLALEAAAGLAASYEHGVCFVDLATTREPRLVASAMTRALGVWETGRGSARATLASFLRDRQILLVLDNFEQVVEAAPLLAELLTSCPRLALIVTSRAALRVRWECELAVAPLPLPDSAAPAVAVDLAENPAVSLFVERARAVRPEFELSDQNAPDVATLCIRLDGLPLAIELAASQVRLLPPRTIAARLTRSSLGLLTGGARDLPARQRTLRAAVDWSYDLLSPAEQAIFRRLAIFPGSFSLEAAAAVCDGGTRDEGRGDKGPHGRHDRGPCRSDSFSPLAPHTSPLEALAALIDHSLVRREPAQEGDPRFRILQTLREYGLERLDASGETSETWRRQAAYFVGVVEQAEQQAIDQWSPEQGKWLQRVEADLDNVRAVLEWSASDDGDLEAGLLLAGGTCRFWDMRGYFGEGRARLGALIAKADAMPGPRSTYAVSVAEVYTRLAAGYLAFAQGDFAASTAHVHRAMPLARELDFTFGVTTALVGLASMAQIRGGVEEAGALLDESEAISRATGDGRSLYHTLYWQGEIARTAGEYDKAVRLLEESLELTRQHGNPWLVGTALFSLGHVALVRGDPVRAAELFAESLALRRPLGDQLGTALAVEALAWVAAAVGHPERAALLFGAAESLREQIGASVEVGWTSDHQRFLEQTRRALDEATFAARWGAGRALGPDEAIALALRIEPAAGPGGVAARPAATTPRLTRRERETVALVAQGCTNRQIAERLVISRGAAANYVQRVLDKLGFHARAQVAAWAVEQGLVTGTPN
jgi:predicted ATPase/DNA-binding CsgD family transcriptional regulator